jgi:hypothetical protein
LRREIAKLRLLFELECCIRRPCELRDPCLVPGIDVSLRQENVDDRDKCSDDGTRREHSMAICWAALRGSRDKSRLTIALRPTRAATGSRGRLLSSVPSRKTTIEETVRHKAVTPGPHPRRKPMKRVLKESIRTRLWTRLKTHLRILGLSLALSGLLTAAATVPAAAQKKYDKGATDTEIKIGNIMPYSGPASAYGIIGKTMSAYMRMINDSGGVNGRKVNFIS